MITLIDSALEHATSDGIAYMIGMSRQHDIDETSYS